MRSRDFHNIEWVYCWITGSLGDSKSHAYTGLLDYRIEFIAGNELGRRGAFKRFFHNIEWVYCWITGNLGSSLVG